MTGRPLRLAVLLSELGDVEPAVRPPEVIELAVRCEAAGADAVFFGEHVVMGPDATREGGRARAFEPLRPGRIDPATPWLEPFTALAAVAGATTRIGLGTAILIAPLRPPVLVAKMASSLDAIAGGRLELGVGVSWHEQEYQALGVEFAARGRRLDELLDVCAALWTRSPASFSGPTLSFDELWLEPKPHGLAIPLWFGGTFSEPMIRRVVAHGHGLAPLPRLTGDQRDRLGAAMRAGGRSLAELDLITGIRPAFVDERGPADLAASLDEIPALVERGYTTFVLWPNSFTASATDLGRVVEEACSRFADLVGELGRRAPR